MRKRGFGAALEERQSRGERSLEVGGKGSRRCTEGYRRGKGPANRDEKKTGKEGFRPLSNGEAMFH